MNWKFLLFLIPLGIISIVQGPMFNDTALLPKFSLFQFFMTVTVIILLIRLLVNKTNISTGVWRQPALLVLGSYCLYSIVAAAYSMNTVDGYFEAMKFLSLFIYLAVLSLWVTDEQKANSYFQRSVIVMSTLILGVGIYQFLIIWNSVGYSFENSYLLTGAFAHRNLFSQVVLFTLPFLVYSFAGSSGWLKHYLMVLLSLSICFLTILFVRSVWVATFVGILVTMLVYSRVGTVKLGRILTSFFRLRFKLSTYIIFAAFLFIAGYGMKLTNAHHYISDQARSMIHIKYGSVGDRLELWEKSATMVSKSPVFGQGLASWKIAILDEGVEGLESQDGVTFYQRPHNDFIWAWAEQGLPGFILYLAFFILLFRNLLKLLKNENAIRYRSFYYTLLYMLVSYTCIAMFSFPRERFAHSVFLASTAALILIHYQRFYPRSQLKVSIVKSLVLLMSVGMLVICTFTIRRALSDVVFKQVLLYKNHNYWDKLLTQVAYIDQQVFNMDYASTPVNWYSGLAYLKIGEFEKAQADLEKALTLNPFHVHIHNNLAHAFYNRGKIDEATLHYRQALKVDEHFKEANLNMAAIYFNKGNVDSAIIYLQHIDTATIDPRYRQYRSVILHQKMEDLIELENDQHTKYTMVGISEKESWLNDVFQKSVMNHISFKEQLYIDVNWSKRMDHIMGKNK